MNNGRTILNKFVKHWENEFKPKKDGKNKKTPAAWSACLREFLEKKFKHVIYECAFPPKVTRRLDAAVWAKKEQSVSPMDIAIEWEWDFGKADAFAKGDFFKVLDAPARAGLAIIKTRSAQKNSLKKAERFIEKMKKKYTECEKKDRPVVGVIEVQRIKSGGGKKKYQCYFHDFSNNTKRDLQKLIW